MKRAKTIIVMLICAIALTIAPMMFYSLDLSGSDDNAGDLALSINKNYEIWIEPPFEPSSDFAENALFLFQSVMGFSVLILSVYALSKRSHELK